METMDLGQLRKMAVHDYRDISTEAYEGWVLRVHAGWIYYGQGLATFVPDYVVVDQGGC